MQTRVDWHSSSKEAGEPAAEDVAKKHVSNAERCINTIKERTQGVIATLPFNRITRCLKIEFVYLVVLWLNAFPVRSGILEVYSPKNC